MSDFNFKKRLFKTTHLTKHSSHESDSVETTDETKFDPEAFERRLREAKSKVGEIQENIDHIARR